MKRRLFNLAAGVSLVLWVATIAMWVRGHRAAEAVYIALPQRGDPLADPGITLVSSAGGLYADFASPATWESGRRVPRRITDQATFSYSRFSGSPQYPSQGVTRPVFRAAGFELAVRGQLTNPPESGDTVLLIAVAAPCWAAACVAAALPLTWCVAAQRRRRQRRRRQARLHVCAVCNYDLRATRDRCPECGAAANAPASARDAVSSSA